MTHYTEADLRVADRHVCEGEQHILRQEKLLSSCRLKGLPTSKVEELLALMNQMQAMHVYHRDAIAVALQRREEQADLRRVL